MDLNKLSLFLEDDIILIPEDTQELLLANKFKSYTADLPEKESVVEEPSENPIAMNETASEENGAALEMAISYEGEFEKGLLVVYQGEQLDEDLKTFLLKILRAVSHSLKDIALVASNHLEELHPRAVNQMNPHKVLIFGRMSHPIIKLKETSYEITSHQDVEYLFADDISVIFDDEGLKRKLWKSLQVFFNISK
ncbi:hypothetical protein [Echinicola sediminis]